MRGKAAEARGLVGFAQEIANNLLDDNDEVERTIKLCAKHIAKCYFCISEDAIFSAGLSERELSQILLAVRCAF